jgi:hypothetical protein
VHTLTMSVVPKLLQSSGGPEPPTDVFDNTLTKPTRLGREELHSFMQTYTEWEGWWRNKESRGRG